ncbi:yigR [Wigglesworthia glossinidia endosymbiont of Glossina brevipalpis]|uniref:YigR protein n=1 Tax=Wigglesworthia glossinidia brevipalpis TaxID=36870 RepID=Q8D381_WIGBR|nr:yigR [Wigglesworthia glossinidia endosymbiont of Glossina brevipalpis]
MIFNKIARAYIIIKIILNYGLDEIIPKKYFIFHFFRKIIFWIPNKNKNIEFSKRLILAIEKLGPIWIKFGQMLSTRNDIFKKDIIKQLQNLQNEVTPFDSKIAIRCIENSMNNKIEKIFNNFNKSPIASASIAQVYTAKLKNGKRVVVKVIRPGIIKKIKSDIKLMLVLAKFLSKIFKYGKNLRLIDIIIEYKKIILNETNLLYEAVHTIQLRRNFKESNMLYIPKVYINYCNENVMISEKINGIKISNIFDLKKNNVNMKLLAERGVKIFFTQVFRDNFFHGDMHPGNIFVSYENPDDPKYIGIDCSIIGRLTKLDKYFLAENFVAFFNRDYRKIAKLHIDSGWVDKKTNVNDLESSIRVVCEPIFEKSLSDIYFGKILLAFFSSTKDFKINIQPQLILLQKTLFYIEGIGKQLYPELNLWKTAKPFLENWIKNETRFLKILSILKENAILLAINFDGKKLFKNSFYEEREKKIKKKEKINILILCKSIFLFLLGTTIILFSLFLFMNENINQILFNILVFTSVILFIFSWKFLNRI